MRAELAGQDDCTELARFQQQHHLKKTPAARMALFGVRKNMADSTEGEAWSQSYLNLGCFIFFSKFCDSSYSTKTHSQASGINSKPQLL